MKNSPVNKLYNLSNRFHHLLILVFLLVLFSSFFRGKKEEVLLTVHDREISSSEFLYHYEKTFQDSAYQDIDFFMEQFIEMHLKLAHAREQQVDRNITFINELTDFRTQLSQPYLTHKEKEEEFAREAYERVLYEVNASHILVKINSDASPEDTLQAYNKTLKMRERILQGESFEKLAVSHSDDPNAALNSGNLGYFSAFQSDYEFETAAYNMKPGEISMPVRSSYGYHIIKLIDKREYLVDGLKPPPYDHMENDLKKWIKEAMDIRTELIKNAFVERLKKEWNFTENQEAIETLISIADERIFTAELYFPANVNSGQVLGTIDGKNLTLNHFADFVISQEDYSGNKSVRDYVLELYDKFVGYRLNLYENYKLDQKYPEFRNQYWEYRDAMLLLEITNREVWLKSVEDSSGLADFFNQNRNNYKWDERIVAGIYTAADKKIAKDAAKSAAKSLKKAGKDNNFFDEYVSEEYKQSLTVQLDTFQHGWNPAIDKIKWKKGVYKQEDNYQFIVVYDVLNPEYKTFSEVQDTLLTDYQSHLMQSWIDELRKKYTVKINQEVLQSVKEDISK